MIDGFSAEPNGSRNSQGSTPRRTSHPDYR